MVRSRVLGGIAVLLLLALLGWILMPSASVIEPIAEPRPAVIAPPSPPAAHIKNEAQAPPPVEAVAPRLPIDAPAEVLPPPPLAASDPKSIAVLDVKDGNPVPGLEVTVALAPVAGDAGGQSVTVAAITDKSGRVEVAPDRTRTIASSSADWSTLPRVNMEETLRSGELWVYRRLTILATIEVEGEDGSFDADAIRATVFPGPRGGRRGDREDMEPTRRRSPDWLRNQGIEGSVNIRATGARFLIVRAPDLGTGDLIFTHPGWIGVVTPLAGLSADGENRVTLKFRRALRVRGVLRDEEGLPLAGKRVSVYTSRRGNYQDGDPSAEWARRTGGGLTIGRSLSKDRSVITLINSAMSGGDGRFEAAVHQDGETLVVLWEEGFEPLHRALGPLHADADLGDLILRKGSPTARVQVLLDGKPQGKAQLVISDFGVPDAQPSIPLYLDSDGRFAADRLVSGGEYGFMLTGPGVTDYRGRWVEWRGEDVVELSKLRLVTDVLTERDR